MSGLPKGWVSTTFQEVSDKIGSGATPKGGHTAYAAVGTPFIRSQNVHFDGFDDNGLTYLTDEQARKLEGVTVRPNDVLLNITGASIGRVTTAPGHMEGARVNQHVAIIRPKAGIEAQFISGFLASPEMQRFIVLENYGVTRQALTKVMIENIGLALPPLPEQRRIVAKIDSLTAKSKRARDHLDHIPRLVEKYKQAVLAAAFRGDLTREWRETHPSEDWSELTIAELLEGIIGGKNLRCEERPPLPHELGVVKVSAVSWGRFDATAAKTLPREYAPAAKIKISTGDFLISRANTLELVGAVVIVEDAPANLYLSDKVLRLEVSEEHKPWLLWFLRSPIGRSEIEDRATGNQLSMRNLSQSELRAIPLPWPGKPERSEIVRRIETAFAWIDRLALDATSARKLVDKLDQAVLAKAFRGELVPQDPNGEPASVLLDRIRAEREEAPKARRGRRKSA